MFGLCRFWQDISPTNLHADRQEFQDIPGYFIPVYVFSSENSRKFAATTSTRVLTPLYQPTFEMFVEAVSALDVHSPFDLLSKTLSIHT